MPAALISSPGGGFSGGVFSGVAAALIRTKPGTRIVGDCCWSCCDTRGSDTFSAVSIWKKEGHPSLRCGDFWDKAATVSLIFSSWAFSWSINCFLCRVWVAFLLFSILATFSLNVAISMSLGSGVRDLITVFNSSSSTETCCSTCLMVEFNMSVRLRGT